MNVPNQRQPTIRLTVCSGVDKKKINILRYWPFARGIHRSSLGFPSQRSSNAENVMSWRHYVYGIWDMFSGVFSENPLCDSDVYRLEVLLALDIISQPGNFDRLDKEFFLMEEFDEAEELLRERRELLLEEEEETLEEVITAPFS